MVNLVEETLYSIKRNIKNDEEFQQNLFACIVNFIKWRRSWSNKALAVTIPERTFSCMITNERHIERRQKRSKLTNQHAIRHSIGIFHLLAYWPLNWDERRKKKLYWIIVALQSFILISVSSTRWYTHDSEFKEFVTRIGSREWFSFACERINDFVIKIIEISCEWNQFDTSPSWMCVNTKWWSKILLISIVLMNWMMRNKEIFLLY